MQNNEPMLAADYTCTLPSMYLIEPGNVCNLKCPFCPTGAGVEGFAPGFMSLETYKTIFGKIRPHAKWIGLYNNGEPLLNKAIIPMIAMASEHGIYTNMSSHLSLPNIDHGSDE